MNLSRYLQLPVYGFQMARSLNYLSQYFLFTSLARLSPYGEKAPKTVTDLKVIKKIQGETKILFQNDTRNISEGIYPISVLIPEDPRSHLARLPKLLWDGIKINFRRANKKTQDFNSKAQKYAEKLPPYFTRNFHFQTDGYLSEKSAYLYDHQVEMLFGGAANAMRRILLRPMKERFPGDGEGLTFLEVGAGTGSMTRFVRLAFPKAKIIASDISYPYLKVAQERLLHLHDIDFIQSDATQLPFRDQHFDAVYSVFLFHELPLNIRKDVLTESYRLLKPHGFLGLVDSIQHGEIPEFDELLKDFPIFFHEPYYKNYSHHPMEELVRDTGFEKIETQKSYVSKSVFARRPQ